MKYYFDTEFIENGSTIDLISIGIVSDDGREYYAINEDCDFRKADDWVLKNVLNPIGLNRYGFAYNILDFSLGSSYRESFSFARSRQAIKEDLLIFFAPKSINKYEGDNTTTPAEECYKKVEIWGYYSSYDWVVLCQLFGKMIDLPQGFPMYCNDIKQFANNLGNPKLPKQEKGKHNALEDARWVREAYLYLSNYQDNLESKK